MHPIITSLTDNIGLGFENTVLLLVTLCGLLFYVKDFRIGIILHFLAYGLCYMWFHYLGYNYVFSLLLMGISLIIMVLSIYATAKTGIKGAIV